LHPSIFILCAYVVHRETNNRNKNRIFLIAGIFDKDIKIMNPLNEIKKSIASMSSGNGRAGLYTAKVLSTDGETCCVDIDGLTASDVQLRAVVNGEESGILVTPKTDSYVTVADMSGNLTRLVVVGFSEVEKIEVNADDKIIFNGGGYGGLVKIEELKNNLDTLKNYVEAMKAAVSAGLSAIGAGTAANGATGKTTFESSMVSQSINFEDMEDTNITH